MRQQSLTLLDSDSLVGSGELTELITGRGLGWPVICGRALLCSYAWAPYLFIQSSSLWLSNFISFFSLLSFTPCTLI